MKALANFDMGLSAEVRALIAEGDALDRVMAKRHEQAVRADPLSDEVYRLEEEQERRNVMRDALAETLTKFMSGDASREDAERACTALREHLRSYTPAS